MIANHYRLLTGRGQQVDVSCQQAVARSLSHAPMIWDMSRMNMQRQGPFRPVGKINLRINWECADGYVNFIQPGGHTGGRSMTNLSNWMDQEGMGHRVLRETDWGEIGFGQLSPELVEEMTPPLERFFMSKTKAHLAEQALERRILLFPVHDPKDVFTYPQLLARNYFRDAELPPFKGESRTMKALGPFISTGSFRRAPRIGEHNREIYQGEMGLSDEEMASPQEEKGHMTAALEGVKVLDFCWVAIGPMTTRYLSDFGATVVRVESIHRVDTLRTATPHKDGVPGINRSGYFANYNGGKRSIALNMSQPRARELAKELAQVGGCGDRKFHPRHHGAVGDGVRRRCERLTPASSCLAPPCRAGAGPTPTTLASVRCSRLFPAIRI